MRTSFSTEPLDSVVTPVGPPARKPTLKDGAVGVAESRPRPALRAHPGGADMALRAGSRADEVHVLGDRLRDVWVRVCSGACGGDPCGVDRFADRWREALRMSEGAGCGTRIDARGGVLRMSEGAGCGFQGRCGAGFRRRRPHRPLAEASLAGGPTGVTTESRGSVESEALIRRTSPCLTAWPPSVLRLLETSRAPSRPHAGTCDGVRGQRWSPRTPRDQRPKRCCSLRKTMSSLAARGEARLEKPAPGRNFTTMPPSLRVVRWV
jgi:hypothetical protein